MRMTVRQDEAAGLTPSQVVAKQQRDEQFRQCYQALLKPGEKVIRVASGFAGVNVGEALKGLGVVR